MCRRHLDAGGQVSRPSVRVVFQVITGLLVGDYLSMKLTTALLFAVLPPLVVKDDCCPGGSGTTSLSSSSDGSTTTDSDTEAEPTLSMSETTVVEVTTGLTTGEDPTSTSVPTTGDLCGNGVLDAGEECDGEARCHDCLIDRIIFNTGWDNRWTAEKLFGLQGADARCNVLATQFGLNDPDGTLLFRAWLSSNGSNVVDRMTSSAGRYVRPDGEVVAESWSDLLAGQLVNAPRITADGKDAFDQPTWSGTLGTSGVWGGMGDCEDWTANTGTAIAGVADSTSSTWSEDQEVRCSAQLSLYCVEQPKAPVCHLESCWQDVDCPFGTSCFPLQVDGKEMKLCVRPCTSDSACAQGCDGAAPTAVCDFDLGGGTGFGLCTPVSCDEAPGCDCQDLDGASVCFE